MLLTISTTLSPATDLGYLLHKNPSRVQSFELTFGQAHVFYPEANDERCTAAMLLDVDPVGLVRDRRGPSGEGHALEQYVNDRPYVASSFLSVAISKVFGTALSGRSKDHQELADTAIPLSVKLDVVPCKGGEDLLRRLFEPLGYTVALQGYPLDERFPDWGGSRYFTLTLEATCRLSELLTHLYVLIPVLDDDKHYWVGDEEVEKLLRFGGEWLSEHPERELIVNRYLRHQRRLTRAAMSQLLDEDQADPDEAETAHSQQEEAIESGMSLNEQRLGAVVSVLKGCGAKRVLDLGCGEGKLIQELIKDQQFEEIVGMDVSHRALETASSRMKFDRMPQRQMDRIRLIHGSLVYRDQRLAGYDAAAVVEVIEHLDAARLAAFERVLFEFARPGTVVLTTPNVEYNVKFETLPAGRFRHKDHRFEWTREEFRSWANGIAERFGYAVRYLPVGPEDPEIGSPAQMAVFEKGSER